MIEVDLSAGCQDCTVFAQSWLQWSQRIRRNAAMLQVTSDAEYLANVGAKTRNMIRKAERRDYRYDEFAHNDHLDAMHDINVSLAVRQGKPMTASYLEHPRAVDLDQHCQRHRKVWIGGFRRGTLLAYCQLVLCGDLAIVNRIIGHGDALKDGVMNGLVRALNAYCDDLNRLEVADPRWINYLTMDCRPSLAAFKRHSGFRPMEVVCR